MSERSWKDCPKAGNSFNISPDAEKAKSLIEIAKDRISQAQKDINEKNVNFVFEDYYLSLIEILHAIALIKGHKIINHICLKHFLKEILKREDLSIIFDDLRYKINSLTNYGNKMEFEVGKDALEKSRELIDEIRKLSFQKGNPL
ncbi:MAG TPA: HEPN domain-containing protein [Candidatus Woesearchaeota archaeon]|nr:HEPN domain-containing protein [Candidatus Woesearchaeota archaeon]